MSRRGHCLAMPKSYDPYAYIIRLEASIAGVVPTITHRGVAEVI
jgi:hypothetical protein